jgi:hypothetical protein
MKNVPKYLTGIMALIFMGASWADLEFNGNLADVFTLISMQIWAAAYCVIVGRK